MAPIVQVQNVFKKYSRNANIHLGYGMRDLFDHLLGRKPSLELRKDEFFAVNDVSFGLEQGDTLALIGRNGSGKSTLLKMMNGIVKPDAGRIVMDGPVDRLLGDQDVQEFYLGFGQEGKRKSYHDVKHYKRRKRWLS